MELTIQKKAYWNLSKEKILEGFEIIIKRDWIEIVFVRHVYPCIESFFLYPKNSINNPKPITPRDSFSAVISGEM